MTSIYPFSALVGQEQLQLALLLNAVCPALGGVLIRGEKGTAKSTAARALAAVLPPITSAVGCPFHCDPRQPWPVCPHCSVQSEHGAVETAAPFVDLPLGATEDRVLGTLDFERALKEARRSFQPGLLAAAHRGVLYVDEVNLLADHLVDVLLDAAALGVNTVEREGITLAHPARFVLVGTMNPEEGDLRPQLLDRFGLMVTVAASRAPEERAEIVRRRLAFEADAETFAEQWAEAQAALRQRIVTAQALLPEVSVDEGLLLFITRLCCEMQVDGLRADLGLYKAARALAAWEGRRQVLLDDIRTVAELVLPHRRRRRPFEPPELDRQRLDRLCEQQQSGSTTPPAAPEEGSEDGAEQIIAPAAAPASRPIELASTPASADGRGRRNRSATDGHGKYVRAVPDTAPRDLALDATLRAAVARGGYRDGRLSVDTADLHRKERSGRVGTLILFVVDASGSMAAQARMAAVKGAVLSLLQSAYEERDRVGVIAFRGPRAELVLTPTSSVELAERALRELPTGGRTPLAHALQLAGELLQRERQAHPLYLPLLVLLSDGRANVCLPETPGDAWQQTLQSAAQLAATGVSALVVDTEAGLVRLGCGQQLSEALAAEHLALSELSAPALALSIRQRACRR